MKSLVLTVLPLTVLTLTLPEVAEAGTVALSDVDPAEVITAGVALNINRFRVPTVSKLVPLTVTDVVAMPVVGVKLEIVGADEATTEKLVVLVALPDGVVTAMEPVVALDGTLTTI